MRVGIPNPVFRSPTALEGKSDVRDDFIYGSLVIADGAASSQKVFTVPQGQAIPQLKGSSVTPTATHHLTHGDHSTNLEKAGEVGASIGEAAVRGISIDVEQAPFLAAGTGYDTYGATPRDLIEILNKVSFALKIGGKKMIGGRVGFFPQLAGAQGSMALATTANSVSRYGGVVVNGVGSGKRLKIPIQIARTDPLAGEFTCASALSFAVSGGVGQETLLTVVLSAIVRGDLR